MRVIRHFNLTAGNLGGDLQGLEECRLSWIASGGTAGDDDIGGGHGTDACGCGTDIRFQHFAHVAQVAVGEYEPYIAATAFFQLRQWGVGVFLGILANAFAHHGVFAHENFGIAAEDDARFLDLLGTDVVDSHDEAARVGGHEFLHAGEVLGFALGGERHLLILMLQMEEIG